ncbi:ABC transporter substrate-binding protein [Roseomonas sp. NAR14]|uniref:ABC transporter substrate-binding protein n=1 Tax=Roseomonas acroporae TaxID=2937791 RepID=A0A9X2BSN4_9PROT|nr:ABC transporter substrate-binding protein [Roseomonas acroporae]MCK8783312.1 ABC transporter substrate-binding protein [Roseomonas acroporae]
MSTTLPARRAFLGLLAAGLSVPLAAHAQGAAPQAVVEALHGQLLGTMREAQRMTVRARYQRLAPAIQAAFDLPTMTRLAVGPPWNAMSPAEQQQLLQAFSEWSIANYAARFDGYSGESFVTTGVQAIQNGDQLVRTQLNRTDGAPVALNYLLRQVGGQWKIVDIYLTGTISELASRRAEFTSLLRDGGPERLIAELQQRTAGMLRA